MKAPLQLPVRVASLVFVACQIGAAIAQPRITPLLQSQWPAPPGVATHTVNAANDHAYLAGGEGGLLVFDIAEPTNCVWVGGYDTIGLAVDVKVVGSHAYVSDYTNGLQVIDVSNPGQCVRVGSWKSSGGLRGGHRLDVAGPYVYLADDSLGLQVIDVSNPASPFRVGGYDGAGVAYDVEVAGRYAYVANTSGPFLDVIDISDPTNCVWVGGYDMTGQARGVSVAGSFAYLPYSYAGQHGGLVVVDVSNPTNCVHVRTYDWGVEALDVDVVGSFAYVADRSGLEVIDISNPAQAVWVGGFQVGTAIQSVFVSDTRICVTYGYVDRSHGLLIVRSLPNVQFTFGIDATPDTQLTIEHALDLTPPIQWTPILTTNPATMPFFFTDDAVRGVGRKFYRVRENPTAVK